MYMGATRAHGGYKLGAARQGPLIVDYRVKLCLHRPIPASDKSSS